MSTFIKKSPWISFFNAGGCIPGDTMMIFEDGQILTAKEIIEDHLGGKKITKLKHNEVLARACEAKTMSWNGTSPRNGKITTAYKLPSKGKLVEINTSTTKLRLTPDHKVLVDSENGPVWKKANNLKKGDHLYSPRKITINNRYKSPTIFDWLPKHFLVKFNKKTKEKIRQKLIDKFGNLRKASDYCEVSYKRLTHLPEGFSITEILSIGKYTYLKPSSLSSGVTGIVNGTDFSKVNLKDVDSDLLYLLGLIASDGCISSNKKIKRPSYKIRFDNTNKQLISKSISLFKLWAPEAKITCKKEENLYRVWLYHYPLAYLATSFGLRGLHKTKDDFRHIFKLPEKMIAMFISGFFDGDGSAIIDTKEDRKKPRISIEFAIKQYYTAKMVQLLLKRLGIVSKIIASINQSTFGTKTMHSVRITNDYDILKFVKSTKSFHSDKRKKFAKIIKLISKDPIITGRLSHAPLISAKKIKRIMKEYSLKRKDIFDPTFLSMIENGKRVEKNTIRHIHSKLKKLGVNETKINKLKTLSSNDFYLDPVKNIRHIKSNERFVYNFAVAETQKYVPEGSFVVSNCNGCTLECFACFSPKYDVTRFGMELKASAKHADVLLVTGIVNKLNVHRLLKIYSHLPEPKRVVAVGACAIDGGLYKNSYSFAGPLDKVIKVDAYIPGCAPRPETIIDGLRMCLNDKGKSKSKND